MEESNDQIYNLFIVGDEGVGKTSLLTRYRTGKFKRNYESSKKLSHCKLEFITNKIIEHNIGVVLPRIISENLKICFNTLDVPGDILSRALINAHYPRAECIIIMFDFTRPETYEDLVYWYKDIIE